MTKLFLLPVHLLIISLTLSCSKSSESNSPRAILTSTKIADTRISSIDLNDTLGNKASEFPKSREALSIVGFDDQDTEHRLLVFAKDFQKFVNESSENIDLTQVELLVNCDEVFVNPEHIELRELTKSWSPQATWYRRYALFQNSTLSFAGETDQNLNWESPGGDFNQNSDALHPAIRSEIAGVNFQLVFDLSSLVKNINNSVRKNYGFIISVKKSEANFKNYISLRTRNNEHSPNLILAFSDAQTVLRN
jgi:hypothetical protein